jgi:hypothetical protein
MDPDKGTLCQKVEKAFLIDRGINLFEQPRLDFRLLAIADRFNEQVAQLGPLKQPAENVVHASAEPLARGFQFLEQPSVNLALARVFCHQVPQVADLV